MTSTKLTLCAMALAGASFALPAAAQNAPPPPPAHHHHHHHHYRTCHGHATTGTVVGAVGGGLIGNAITHGGAVGTLGGAAAGGVVGHQVGKHSC